ncbi:unnamed protein product [Haemonchus placei]|uniref:Enamelin n=1 Tax=Haemonchus placei TaxID=6290 RepID=A0A0N4WGU4_HAEPC|nr:unnamed protein product [Haemonchus placei]
MYVAQILCTWLLLQSFPPTALTQRHRQRKDRRRFYSRPSGEPAENEDIRDGSALFEKADSMQRPFEGKNPYKPSVINDDFGRHVARPFQSALPSGHLGRGIHRRRHARPFDGRGDVFTNGPYNNRMNARPFDEVRKGPFGSSQYMPRAGSYYHGNAAPYGGRSLNPYMLKERPSYSWNNRWSSMSSRQMYMPSTEERKYGEPNARPYSEVFRNPYTPEELPLHHWNYVRPFRQPRMPFEGEDYIGKNVEPSDDVSKEDLIPEGSRNSGEDPATEEDKDSEDVVSKEGQDMRKYARPNAGGFLNPYKSEVPPYYNWNYRRPLNVMQPYLSAVDKEEMRNDEEHSEVSEKDQVSKEDEDIRKNTEPYTIGDRNTNMPGDLPQNYEVFLKTKQRSMQPKEKDSMRIDEESSENVSERNRFLEEDEGMQRHTRSYEEEVPNSRISEDIPYQNYGEPNDAIQQDMPFTEEDKAPQDNLILTMLSLSTTQTSYEDIRSTTPIPKGEGIQDETVPTEGITPTTLPRLTAQTTTSDSMLPETPIAEVKNNRDETVFREGATTTSYKLTAKTLSNTAAPTEGITGISLENMTPTMPSRWTAQTSDEGDRLRTPSQEGKDVRSESVSEEAITSTMFPSWTAQRTNESSQTTTPITEGNDIQNVTGVPESMAPTMLFHSPSQTSDEGIQSSTPITGRNDSKNGTDPAEAGGMPPVMGLRSPPQTSDGGVQSSTPFTGRNDSKNGTDPAEAGGMPPLMVLRSPAQAPDEDVHLWTPITKEEGTQNETVAAESMPPTILSQSPAQTTLSEESTKMTSFNLTADAIPSNNSAVPFKGIKFETPIVCSMDMQWYRCRSARK